MSIRILVVDDERQITRVLRTTLESYGYTVTVAQDGAEALRLFEAAPPNLVITDLSMPKMDGVELTAEIRKLSTIPVIVLSVRDQDSTKVTALDAGADDYVTKPFSTPELLARVRVQLRRRSEEEPVPARITEGDFTINVEAHRVVVRGQELHLTPKEFDLLLLFVQNAGRVLTHKTLLRAIWGAAGEHQPEYLRVLIAQLRRKIDQIDVPSAIESEPWIGYRFRASQDTGS